MGGLGGGSGRRSEVLNEWLRRLGEERKESAHEREIDGSQERDGSSEKNTSHYGQMLFQVMSVMNMVVKEASKSQWRFGSCKKGSTVRHDFLHVSD